MNSLVDGFVLSVMAHLVDKPSGYWNARLCWKVFQAVGLELKNYGERKPFRLWSAKWNGLQTELLRSDSRLGSLIILSGVVHTRVEVCRMDLELSRLVEWPWLQLMCCAAVCHMCCSNHSSLKDKWSHNEQSSPMGYQVTNGEITRELDKEPSLHCSSIYIIYMWSMLQQYCPALMSMPLPHVHYSSSMRLP